MIRNLLLSSLIIATSIFGSEPAPKAPASKPLPTPQQPAASTPAAQDEQDKEVARLLVQSRECVSDFENRLEPQVEAALREGHHALTVVANDPDTRRSCPRRCCPTLSSFFQ